MTEVMASFKGFCGRPSIHGAIDMTQIHIQKLKGTLIGDFFSFKSKSYNMQLQVVVHNQKKFTDIFVGMPNSMNDVCILRISSLYQRAMYGDMFRLNQGEDKYQALHTWGQRLHLVVLVDDSSQANCKCAPYY